MQDIQLASTDTIEPAALYAAFIAAFSDYLVTFTFPIEQWPHLLARHVANLALGRAALRDGEVVAFALVAPRPELGSWRVAAMGALPSARGSGVAPMLLDDFIQRAAGAGMGQVELECFAQNERAVRLYRSRGFEVVHPLYGYVLAAGAPRVESPSSEAVLQVELQDAFAWLDAASLEMGDLPLQVTPPSLKAQGAALQAWRCGNAQLAFTALSPDTVTVQSLVDRDPAQRDAQQLIAHLLERYPTSKIAVPQLQRPDIGGNAFQRMGFERLPLHGVLMRRAL